MAETSGYNLPRMKFCCGCLPLEVGVHCIAWFSMVFGFAITLHFALYSLEERAYVPDELILVLGAISIAGLLILVGDYKKNANFLVPYMIVGIVIIVLLLLRLKENLYIDFKNSRTIILLIGVQMYLLLAVKRYYDELKEYRSIAMFTRAQSTRQTNNLRRRALLNHLQQNSDVPQMASKDRDVPLPYPDAPPPYQEAPPPCQNVPPPCRDAPPPCEDTSPRPLEALPPYLPDERNENAPQTV